MANNKDLEVIIPIDYNELLQQAVAVLPWGHTAELMTNKETKDNDDAILYYATETVSKGWSRDILVNAINLRMYEQSCLPTETDVDVELSLDGMDKPIGVADYRLIIPQEGLKLLIQQEIQAYDDEKLIEQE